MENLTLRNILDTLYNSNYYYSHEITLLYNQLTRKQFFCQFGKFRIFNFPLILTIEKILEH